MNKPEKRFKCGPISASIWAQGRTVDGEMVKFYSMNIDKSYRDGDGWKHTTVFAVEDLPKVASLATEVYKHIRLKSDESNEDST
jgi:hypothetical protein